MKHLAANLRRYNELKQLMQASLLQEAYREMEQLPLRRASDKIIRVNLYSLLALAQQQHLRALQSLSAVCDAKNVLMGLTLSNIAYVHFRQRRFFEAESFSLKAIPLLEAELAKLTSKKHPSKTVLAQVKLLLIFCYLLMIYACCQNDEYKRAYDYILKTKRVCGAIMRQELEHQLKAVKEVYKYKLAFGGLHQERLRHLEHHRLIVKNLEQETKYHHEANEKRGDKIQLKLERLNRELIEQANRMTLEGVKQHEGLKPGPSEEDSQQSENEQREVHETQPMPTLYDMSHTSTVLTKGQSADIIRHEPSVSNVIASVPKKRMASSAKQRRRQPSSVGKAADLYLKPLAEIPTIVSETPTKLRKLGGSITQRTSTKVIHIIELLNNPIYPESHHPETIFKSGGVADPKGIRQLRKSIAECKCPPEKLTRKTMKNTSSTNTPRFNSRHSKKPAKKQQRRLSNESIGDSSSDGMVSAENVFVKGLAFPAQEVVPARHAREPSDARIQEPVVRNNSKEPKQPEDNANSLEKQAMFHSFGGEASNKRENVDYQTGKRESTVPNRIKRNQSDIEPQEAAGGSKPEALKKTGSVKMPDHGDPGPHRLDSIITQKRTLGEDDSRLDIDSPKKTENPTLQRATTINHKLIRPEPIETKRQSEQYQQQTLVEEEQSKPSKSPRFQDEPPEIEEPRMTFGRPSQTSDLGEGNAIGKHKVIRPIIKKKGTGHQTEQLALTESQSPKPTFKSHLRISIVEHAAEYHSEGEGEQPSKNSDEMIKLIAEERVVLTASENHPSDSPDPLQRESVSEQEHREEQQLDSALPKDTDMEPNEEAPSFEKKKPMRTEPAENEAALLERQRYAQVMLRQRGSAKETHSEHEFESNGRQRSNLEQKEHSANRQDGLSQRGTRTKKARKGSHYEPSVKASSIDLVAANNQLIRNLNNCLEGEKGEYAVQYSYHKAGTTNCNQILQLFLNEIRNIDESKRKAAGAFVWLMKRCIDDHYGPSYGQEKDAEDIALLANKFVLDVQPKYEREAPFSFEVLIDLTEIFFLWLYRRKLTKYMIREMED